MDFGLAFSYVFKDKDWFRKIGIISLVALIPIVGQIVVYGWMLNITKRVMDRDPNPLPDMDFGADLSRGFMGFVISFVYSLPMLSVYGMIMLLSVASSYSGSEQTAEVLAAFLSICAGFFMLVYGIFVALIVPAAVTRYLEKASLSAAFDFSEVFKQVRLNPGAYFMVVLGTLVAGLIAPIGLIACIIGVMLTYTYSMAVMGHFYGQAHNEANKNKRVVEIPPSSPEVI